MWVVVTDFLCACTCMWEAMGGYYYYYYYLLWFYSAGVQEYNRGNGIVKEGEE